MKNLNNETQKYIFSSTKSEVIFVNIFDKFAFAIIIAISSICIVIDFSISIKAIFFILILVVPFIVLFNSHFKKIKDIEKVENRGYITFHFNGGDRILWKKRQNEDELISLLKRITVVQ